MPGMKPAIPTSRKTTPTSLATVCTGVPLLIPTSGVCGPLAGSGSSALGSGFLPGRRAIDTALVRAPSARGELGAERGSRTRNARDRELPVESCDAVGEPAQPAA